MAEPFSKLMAGVVEGPDGLALEVPEDWMQGRSVFGGLQVALALRAMRALVPGVVLRTLQATFVGPVPQGRMCARATVLRSGKSAVHVEAHVFAGPETLAIVHGVFGAARASGVRVTPERPPISSSRPIELPFLPGLTPSFTQHFQVRWLRGMPPFTGDTSLEHVLEIALRDEGGSTEGHVVAIADFMPPLALAHLGAPAPGSTLTWMLELLSDRLEGLPLAGWRADGQLVAARDGYTSQSVTLWAPDGAPVALSRQSMLVYG